MIKVAVVYTRYTNCVIDRIICLPIFSSQTEALDLNPHSEFASPHCVRNEDAPVDEFELDRSIHALKAKICAIRGLESFDDSDVEAELKKWRELLHEYNEAKDSCLYVFGQLSHLKLTTVRELYNEHNLDIDA